MTKDFFIYLVAMALVTYAVRMIPFVAMRGKIKSVYIRSFLYYVPYAVLGAMTLPYIFYAIGNIATAVCGTAVAFVLAYKRKSLLTVAISACLSAFAAGFIF